MKVSREKRQSLPRLEHLHEFTRSDRGWSRNGREKGGIFLKTADCPAMRKRTPWFSAAADVTAATIAASTTIELTLAPYSYLNYVS